MNRFHHIKTSPVSTNNPVPNGHPTFKLGAIIATKWTDYEHALANLLNQSQHRIGFRMRNGLLALTGLVFLLYFIALLT